MPLRNQLLATTDQPTEPPAPRYGCYGAGFDIFGQALGRVGQFSRHKGDFNVGKHRYPKGMRRV